MNTLFITQEDCLNVLKGIEEGKIKIEFVPGVNTRGYDTGNLKYRTDNGWEIVVFNDYGSFDYIDAMISPSGSCVEPFDDYDEWKWEELCGYRPPDEVILNIYGIEEEA